MLCRNRTSSLATVALLANGGWAPLVQSRPCSSTSSSSSSSSPSSPTSSSSSSSSSTTSSSSTLTSSTSPPPTNTDGMKMTHIGQSEWLAENQFDQDKPWCSVTTLYRRLLKLYIRKFRDHPEIIIRAWKQTKFEFVHFRDAPAEDVSALVNRGRLVHNAVQGGIVPVVQDPKSGLVYCKYDKETLIASGGVIDPISAEEFLRRNHDKLSENERNELREKLQASGRWKGPNEFSADDVPKIKVKKKVKCTDPDE